jgi:hypothetical protein
MRVTMGRSLEFGSQLVYPLDPAVLEEIVHQAEHEKHLMVHRKREHHIVDLNVFLFCSVISDLEEIRRHTLESLRVPECYSCPSSYDLPEQIGVVRLRPQGEAEFINNFLQMRCQLMRHFVRL